MPPELALPLEPPAAAAPSPELPLDPDPPGTTRALRLPQPDETIQPTESAAAIAWTASFADFGCASTILESSTEAAWYEARRTGLGAEM